MLRIDCLLKDTALAEDIAKAVKYVALDRAARGKDASLKNVYNDLREAGVEVDMTTAAHMYANTLPLYDARFTSIKDMEEETGRRMASTLRDLILQKPKEANETIGDQSPSQYVANRIAQAFANTLIETTRDKSVMKTLQDAMLKGAEAKVGKVESQGNEKPTVEEIIQKALDVEGEGFRDMKGQLNGIKTLFEATKKELQKYSDEVRDRGDEHTVELWNEYVDAMENASYSLLFSRAEGKQILKEALLPKYGRETKRGRIIDWNKLAGGINDIPQLRQNVMDAFRGKFGEDNAEKIANALQREYQDIRGEIVTHSMRTLSQKEGMIDADRGVSKSEMTRLAEFHDMGIFEGAHNKLLAHILGIEPHDQEAMDQVKQYAEQLSKLRQLMEGNDFIVPSMQRKVAQSIHEIVAANVENKTKLLKTISTINKIYQVENSSLVSGYRNILENHLSGLFEFLTTKANAVSTLGKELGGFNKDAAQNAWDTWRNVAMGGKEFGDAPYQVGGNQIRISDQYNIRKMKGADWKNPKTYLKGAMSAVLSVPRAFLSGTDGAFKTTNYRMHFLMGMKDALVNTGKYNNEQAIQFINDAMYGEGALDRAKERAKDLYEQSGIPYVSQKEINITANELLHENLLRGEEVTPDMLHEVQNSAFHQAGLGMGHESNNPISKVIQSSKLHFQREESQAFNEGDYNRAARQRMYNTLINSVVLRFAASQYNWAWLKVEQSGVGLLSGLYHYNKGKKISDKGILNLTAKEREQMAEEYQLGRQKMFRGALGMAANAATAFVVIPLLAKALNPGEEDPTQKLFDDMEDNFLAKALFLKTSPIWGLGQYYYHGLHSEKNKEGDAFDMGMIAAGETLQNVLNFGEKNNAAIKFAEASKMAAQGIKSDNQKTIDKAKTKYGQFLSSYLPHVPFYKQGKDVLQTVDYLATGEEPMYRFPYGFMSGLFAGGIVEDLGLLGNKPIQALPYVGKGNMEAFHKRGINTMQDLKDKYGTGRKADKFIESVVGKGDKAEKAKKAYHAEVGE